MAVDIIVGHKEEQKRSRTKTQTLAIQSRSVVCAHGSFVASSLVGRLCRTRSPYKRVCGWFRVSVGFRSIACVVRTYCIIRSEVRPSGRVGPDRQSTDPIRRSIDGGRVVRATDPSGQLPFGCSQVMYGTHSFVFRPSISNDESIDGCRAGMHACTYVLNAG